MPAARSSDSRTFPRWHARARNWSPKCGRSLWGFWRSCSPDYAAPHPGYAPPISHRHDQILVLDAHRKRPCHIGALHQPGARLDVDLEAAHLDAAGVAPGFAGADVVFPGVPGTADHLAFARIAIGARFGRRHEAGEMAFRQRAALVRATIRHRKELAGEIEDDKLASADLDELASPRCDIAGLRDHVFRHYSSFSPYVDREISGTATPPTIALQRTSSAFAFFSTSSSTSRM